MLTLRCSSQTQYPKLKTLKDLISFRYKSISSNSRIPSSEGSHDLSDEILSSFLSFDLGFEGEREVVEVIALFLSTAGVAFPTRTVSTKRQLRVMALRTTRTSPQPSEPKSSATVQLGFLIFF